MALCQNEGYGCERGKDMGAMDAYLLHKAIGLSTIFLEWQLCHDSVEAAWLRALKRGCHFSSKCVYSQIIACSKNAL